jgi:hypothetical protein
MNTIPKIFVSVASYRDKLCKKTLESIFSNAEFPQRIFIGICQQNASDDSDCTDFNSEILKSFSNNIKTIRISHLEAKGPCVARYWCSTLWNGEEYFLQADSHILMAKNWDTKAINMINEIKTTTSSQKPLLSHYVKAYEEYDQPNPENHVPRMCQSFFNDRGMISFLGSENIPIDNHTYIQTPYIAGGFMFVESKFLQEVPFDPHLDYLFVGEEILMSIRAWTSGYDIYTPSENLMFHLYTRKNDNKIWTDKTYTDTDAFNKVKLIIGLQPDTEMPKYILEHIDRYNIGNTRSLQDYYDFAGIDIVNKKISKNFCRENNENDITLNQTNDGSPRYIKYIYYIILLILIIILIGLIISIHLI